MILGLTGGLGCGKSTAATLFAKHGLRHIDSDRIIRERVLTETAVVKAVRDRFGDAVTDNDGRVRRDALGPLVFADDGARLWLEGITHQIYYELLRSDLRSNPSAQWVVEVPLLFEVAMENWFDFIACVACSYGTQIARLEQRGMDRALAEQRISKQLPLARKIELSDFVLWNDGDPAFLKSQVDRVVDAMTEAQAAIPFPVPHDGTSPEDRR